MQILNRNRVTSNEEITLMCAVRYAIGRSSYAPSAVIGQIISREPYMLLSQKARLVDLLEREIAMKKLSEVEYKHEWEMLVNILRD